MRVSVKALRTKPPVSVSAAVGYLELKADNLADSALLTAVASAFGNLMRGDIPNKRLVDEIGYCAKEVARQWQNDEQEFEMIQPKRRKR